jgi:SAM-dependent methyltransferase
VCGAATAPAGAVRGFALRRCDACGFAYVRDPLAEVSGVYSRAYYEGRGADPLVDYLFELEHPERTVRRLEWSGLFRMVEALAGPMAGRRWLDFGCGNGGLVRVARTRGIDAVGFEEGWIAGRARAAGIPILRRDELDGPFDVVTAVEVLEHVLDPVAELRLVRSLLRAGGLFLLTTGNAAPYRDGLDRWRYVVPEIHISFFEPRTLEVALRAAGLRPQRAGRVAGFDAVMTYKVLKNLRVRRWAPWMRALPKPAIARAADRMTRLSDQPVGWA